MAVDHQTPRLLATARKKRFLGLIQALCDEFDSMHTLALQDQSSPADQRPWSLPLTSAPLSSLFRETDRLSPCERPWGPNSGRPPSSRLFRSASAPSLKDCFCPIPSGQRGLPAAQAEQNSKVRLPSFLPPVTEAVTRIGQTDVPDLPQGCMDQKPNLTNTGSGNAEAVPEAVQEPAEEEEEVEVTRKNTTAYILQANRDFKGNLNASKKVPPPIVTERTSPSGDKTMLQVGSGSAASVGLSESERTGVSEMAAKALENLGAQNHWTSHHIESIYKRSGLLSSQAPENCLTAFTETSAFKCFTAGLIIGNSLFVGIEMDVSMQQALDDHTRQQHEALQLGNHIFTILFTMELLVRVVAYRLHFFFGDEMQWNWFDTVIVASALLEYMLSGVKGFSAMRVLRALRLAKTLRIIRVVTVFRNLQLIVQGLLNSLLSLLWMIFLLLLAVYLVSIVFVGAASNYLIDEFSAAVPDDLFVGRGDDLSYGQMQDLFDQYYPTIPRAMYTMFLTVTGGIDWYTVVQPMMHLSFIYALIFALYIIFVVFGIFNVLNAVFVESVLTNRDKDLLIQSEQAKTKVFMRDLADLFKEGDKENNGGFSREELKTHCKNNRFCAYLSTHALDAGDANVLFDLLDSDGDGVVDVEEFVLGAMKLKGPARCLDMLKMQANNSKLQDKVDMLVAASQKDAAKHRATNQKLKTVNQTS